MKRVTDNLVYTIIMQGDIISKINKMNNVSRKKATIGIFGKSGEGKSSLLSAVLGKKDLLPSGCFGACTAVVTQVEANLTDSNYTAEIELFSKEEWEKELEDIFRVLSDESEDRNQDLFDIAVEKITALYGDDADKKTDELKKDDKFAEIETFLSISKKTISNNDKLRDCSFVWIVSAINRASTDKDPWGILKHCIEELGPGGECKSINFICTKTDDINPAAYIRSTRLTRDQFSGDKIETKVKVYTELEKNLKKALKELDSRFDTIYSDLEQRLSKGVEESVQLCVASTKAMISPNMDKRGFHKILQDLCKNSGCYWSKNWDVILDLNKQLSKHMHEYISEYFNLIFPVTGTTGKSVQEQTDKFSIIQSDSAYPGSPILHHIQYCHDHQ
ncbi:Nuclear GTPase SLIP-GC [Anabarilius grahami]|uniref:Nuclear GTPase SLIP-GC n=1 Tax=Anabarilius grahami TaxID=495550 RepID=A0A3N0YRU9_ANAGA|nr:Nuclear GTPase SLIP-GC [Anabarilius grahami]